MPSKISLQKGEYYGNKRNHFWHVMFRLFDKKYTEDYNEKIALIKNNNLALWDALLCCERKTSMDKDIINETPNDIEKILKDHEQIKIIVFNGQKAYQTFKKNFYLSDNIEYIKMPSTSPIPRKNYRNFEDIYKAWERLKNYLQRSYR